MKRLWASSYPSGREAVELTIYFDSGSPYTFMHRVSALKVGNLMKLPEPKVFSGLGGGNFQSSQILLLHIKLLNFWCSQLVYVVDDEVLEASYDVLTGHDFMQLYGIKLLPEKGDIEIDKQRLMLSQKVRGL